MEEPGEGGEEFHGGVADGGGGGGGTDGDGGGRADGDGGSRAVPAGEPGGRGLHSSAFQLNLSRF